MKRQIRCNNHTIEEKVFDSARLLEELNTMVTEEGGVRKRAGDRVQEGLEVLGTFTFLTEQELQLSLAFILSLWLPVCLSLVYFVCICVSQNL